MSQMMCYIGSRSNEGCNVGVVFIDWRNGKDQIYIVLSDIGGDMRDNL